MGDETKPKTSEEIALARDELELRKYEAQLGVRKVIYGTLIVGLAGVLVPAAIEGWGLIFQKLQNEAQLAFERSQAEDRLRFEEQSRQEEFLQTHFETAIAEDLELRRRFAEYYAYTVDSYDGTQGQKLGSWGRYYEELKRQRKELRKEIIDKERAARVILAKLPDTRTDDEILSLAELEIELDWLYDEIEYTEPGRDVKPRSSVLAATDEATKPGTVAHYKSILGSDAYGPDTSNLIPTQPMLISVLGEPGQQIERCLTRIDLPLSMKVGWLPQQRISQITVHRAVANNFQKAFQSIADSDLDLDRELVFAGLYVKRNIRGAPTNWSRHSFGIEIDLNAEGNEFGAGQDNWTMHPIIVKSFKEAGFAWSGDRNRDGMSFPISSETLNQIAASGFDPKRDCEGETLSQQPVE